MAPLDSLVRDEGVNAGVGWVLVAVTVAATAVAALDGQFLWALLSLVFAATVALPAAVTRDWRLLVSWPVVALGAGAVVAPSVGAPAEPAGYVAVAALALVAVVELDAFTATDLSRRFAAVFVALTTMAVQALWSVAQFYSDVWLGTSYIPEKTELQWDFVAVTAVAVAVGVLFAWYADRFERVEAREDSTGRAGSP